jgi:plasmid stabilization system protein ParE
MIGRSAVAVVFRPEAQAELADAIDWYEARSVGLGAQFVLAVDAAVARIARDPETYPVVYRDVRRARLRRFPYALFYITRPERVIILACFHGRRNPRSWQQRP